MKFIYFSIPIYIFILFASPAHAANVGDVVINEIAWMGTTNYHGDEWVELYNNTSDSISLDGWVLKSTDDKPTINLEGNIPPGGFFLLERTDDTSIPNQQADQIYTGVLGNNGEHLELADNEGNLIDNVNAWGKVLWEGFGGDNDTKQTMERKSPNLTGSDPVSWATSIDVGGTPKTQNSVYQLEQTTDEELTSQEDSTSSQSEPTEESTATSSMEVSASPPPSYPTNIFINEVMPYPLGPDSLEEWVELINENEKPSDISGWKIKDTLGSINTYTFPEGTTISAASFLVFSRPTTKITMNNDRDAIQLIRPDGELIQTVTYQKAPKGKSYVRVKGAWDWSAVPTPGSANILPLPRREKGTIKDVKKIIEKTMTNAHNNNTTITNDNDSYSSSSSSSSPPSSSSPLTASIGQASPKNSSSYITALLASSIAFLSAVFIFILKKRLSKS